MTHRNRGDALLRLKRTAQAAASYAQCVELTRQALATNPTNADSLALQAYCQARRGEAKAAIALMARAAALSPADNEVLFEQAVVFALAQQPCDALAALAAAIQKGYSVALAARDDDLRALAGHPEYVKLTGVSGPKGRWAGVSCPR